jgi:IcmF-related N-terminal domain
MTNLISKPWELVCWLWGLAFPMLSEQAGAPEKANPAGRWAARTVLVAFVLLILGLVNNASRIGLYNWIPHPLMGKIWLPLFGLCLYVLLWLGWWLYRVLSLDVGIEESEFPDIDRAWAQAMEALDRAEIRLDSTPLFLILGWNSGAEESLFQAGGIKAKVNQVPRDDKGEIRPLHVTADREGVWLTCPGVSLLGQQNPAIMGQEGGEGPLQTLAQPSADPFATMGIDQVQGLRREDVLERAGNMIAEARSPAKAIRGDERERYSARLRHLCRLVKRDRQGFCPINGVLVLLPISAADPKSRPDEIAEACRGDLTEVFQSFRMRCPVLVLVPDLERLEGFRELVQRLPESQRGKRMGQRFPLVAELSDTEFSKKVESSVDWTVSNLFASMVYSMFEVETNRGIDEVDQVLNGNQQLFRFLGRTRERCDQLAHLVRQCLPNLSGNRLMFGGCYFAGTGSDPETDQAFASGVLMRLIQEQDSVTWTDDALKEDASFLRASRTARIVLGFVIALLLVAILGLLGVKFWSGRDAGGQAPPA